MTRQNKVLRLGPGFVYTGWCRAACDGAAVELTYVERDGAVIVEKAKLLEVHDIGTVGLKAERETAWFLKRCVTAIQAEGLLLIVDGEVFTIPPDRVDTSNVAYQQYLSPAESSGPFRK